MEKFHFSFSYRNTIIIINIANFVCVCGMYVEA